MRLLAKARQGSLSGQARWGYGWWLVTAAVAACGPKSAPDAAFPAAVPATESVTKPAPSKRLTFYEALAAAKDGDLLPEPDETVVNLEAESAAIEKKVLEARDWRWKQRPTVEWYTETTFFAAARAVLEEKFRPTHVTVTDHYLHEGIVAVYDSERHRIVAAREPHRRERRAKALSAALAGAFAEAAVADALGHLTIPDSFDVAGEIAMSLRAADAKAVTRAAMGEGPFTSYLKGEWHSHYGAAAGQSVDLRHLAVRGGMGASGFEAVAAAKTPAERRAALERIHAAPPKTFAHFLAPGAARADAQPFLPVRFKAPGHFLTQIQDPGRELLLRLLLWVDDPAPVDTAGALVAVRGGAAFASAGDQIDTAIYVLADGPSGVLLKKAIEASKIGVIYPITNGYLALLGDGKGSASPSDFLPFTGLEKDTTPLPRIPLPKHDDCDGAEVKMQGNGRVINPKVPCGRSKNDSFWFSAWVDDDPFNETTPNAADWMEDRKDAGFATATYRRFSARNRVGFLATTRSDTQRVTFGYLPLCGGKKSLQMGLREPMDAPISDPFSTVVWTGIEEAACAKGEP
jgi:hypothetical protein